VTSCAICGSDLHLYDGFMPAVATLGLVGLLDLYCATRLSAEGNREAGPLPDYSGSSGFPDAPERMRGAALDLPGDEFVP
jgi:hypothetical protein